MPIFAEFRSHRKPKRFAGEISIEEKIGALGANPDVSRLGVVGLFLSRA